MKKIIIILCILSFNAVCDDFLEFQYGAVTNIILPGSHSLEENEINAKKCMSDGGIDVTDTVTIKLYGNVSGAVACEYTKEEFEKMKHSSDNIHAIKTQPPTGTYPISAVSVIGYAEWSGIRDGSYLSMDSGISGMCGSALAEYVHQSGVRGIGTQCTNATQGVYKSRTEAFVEALVDTTNGEVTIF